MSRVLDYLCFICSYQQLHGNTPLLNFFRCLTLNYLYLILPPVSFFLALSPMATDQHVIPKFENIVKGVLYLYFLAETSLSLSLSPHTFFLSLIPTLSSFLSFCNISTFSLSFSLSHYRPRSPCFSLFLIMEPKKFN